MGILQCERGLSHPAEGGECLSHNHRPRPGLGQPGELVRAPGERRHWVWQEHPEISEPWLQGSSRYRLEHYPAPERLMKGRVVGHGLQTSSDETALIAGGICDNHADQASVTEHCRPRQPCPPRGRSRQAGMAGVDGQTQLLGRCLCDR